MKSRFTKAFAVVGVLTLALTGCTEAKIGIDIEGDNTAATKMSFEIDRAELDKTLANYGGLSSSEFLQELKTEAEKSSGEGQNIDAKVIDEDDIVGIELSSAGAIPEDGNASQGAGTETIIKQDDNYVVTVPVNEMVASFAELGDPKDIFTSFDVHIAFPGDVVEANYDAKTSGNEVLWNTDNVLASLEANEPLVATGSAKAGGIPVLLGIVIGLLVLAGAGGAAYVFYFKDKLGKKNDDSNEDSVDNTVPTPPVNWGNNGEPAQPAKNAYGEPHASGTNNAWNQPSPQSLSAQSEFITPQPVSAPTPPIPPLPRTTPAQSPVASPPDTPSSPSTGGQRKLPPLPPLPPRR